MVSAFDLLVLSQVPNIGPARLRALVSHFGNSADVFRASARDLGTVEGFSRKLASECVGFRQDPRSTAARRYAEQQLSRLNTSGGRVVTYWDRDYPDALKRIYDPPPFYFARGDSRREDAYALAIVGTRAPSAYGIAMAERFSLELVRIGITVVSGLARGVDTVAHWTAVRNGGRTLAVIGSGLDVVYPPENKQLFDRIAQQGAVISEYPMGAKPDAMNFPRRNRIISGLSLGTLLIETDLNGGAMITANSALDQNREVFAVPGPVTSRRSRGCHALIKDGRAKLVEGVDDLLAELSAKLQPLIAGVPGDTGRAQPPPHLHSPQAGGGRQRQVPDLSLFEKSVYDAVGDEPLYIDAIAGRSGTTAADALVHLLSLEFKGLVRQLAGKFFVRR